MLHSPLFIALVVLGSVAVLAAAAHLTTVALAVIAAAARFSTIAVPVLALAFAAYWFFPHDSGHDC
ncbi:MAG: hypothetical protein GX595_15705 [Lentisphaerae bacterium]|nr:hypothetical protein [Lentisphaerota bacterium]